jgi:hypothetical protein
MFVRYLSERLTSGLLVLARIELHVQKNKGRESYLCAGAGDK